MVQLVIAGQAITLALLGLLGSRLGKVKKDAAAAREQVENNHRHPDGTVINLREENDSRHAETKGWIDELRGLLTGEIRTLRRDVGGIRQELRDDRRANHESIHALDQRVTKIERTES
ncbi:hypothetical protein ACWGKB_20765 [Bacillus velezensis]